jgi:hypothetical protein
MLKLLCSRGKDAPEQMELEGSENDKPKQATHSVFEDLSECLICEATCSQVCSIVHSWFDIESGKSAFTYLGICYLLFVRLKTYGINLYALNIKFGVFTCYKERKSFAWCSLRWSKLEFMFCITSYLVLLLNSKMGQLSFYFSGD